MTPNVFYDLASRTFEKRPPLYAKLSVPCEFDSVMAQLVRSFTFVDSETRSEFSLLLSRTEKGTLLAFAERMANLSLNTGLPETISDGLLAMAISGFEDDYRDVYPVLNLLCISALTLSLNPDELLDRAARYAGTEGAAQHLRGFDRAAYPLEKMGYRRQPISTDGFYYRRIW